MKALQDLHIGGYAHSEPSPRLLISIPGVNGVNAVFCEGKNSISGDGEMQRLLEINQNKKDMGHSYLPVLRENTTNPNSCMGAGSSCRMVVFVRLG